MAKSTVKDIDKGWRRIVEELNVLNDYDVFVGIHSTARSSDETGELTAAAIGAIHEFGTKDGRILPRPWLRTSIDHFSREISEKYGEIFRQVTKGQGFTAKRGLNRLGLFTQAKVRAYFTRVGQSEWPDISDETKLAKGSTGILIDSGFLRRGVTYTVRPADVSALTIDTIAQGIDRPQSTQTKKGNKQKRSLKRIKADRRKAASERKRERKKATKERRKVAKKTAREAKKRREFMKKLRRDQARDEKRAAQKATKKAKRTAKRIKDKETRKRVREAKREAQKQIRGKKKAAKKIQEGIKRARIKAKKKVAKQRAADKRARAREKAKAQKAKAKARAVAKRARDRAKRASKKKPTKQARRV